MRGSVLRILSLIRKELIALLRDPRSRVILFLPALLQSVLFGYAASFDLNHAPYAVLDDDRSAASRDLLAHFDGSGVFLKVADLRRASELEAAIDTRRALVGVHIPVDFERTLRSGLPVGVQVVADGRNSNTAATALGYVNAIVERFNTDWRA